MGDAGQLNPKDREAFAQTQHDVALVLVALSEGTMVTGKGAVPEGELYTRLSCDMGRWQRVHGILESTGLARSTAHLMQLTTKGKTVADRLMEVLTTRASEATPSKSVIQICPKVDAEHAQPWAQVPLSQCTLEVGHDGDCAYELCAATPPTPQGSPEQAARPSPRVRLTITPPSKQKAPSAVSNASYVVRHGTKYVRETKTRYNMDTKANATRYTKGGARHTAFAIGGTPVRLVKKEK